MKEIGLGTGVHRCCHGLRIGHRGAASRPRLSPGGTVVGQMAGAVMGSGYQRHHSREVPSSSLCCGPSGTLPSPSQDPAAALAWVSPKPWGRDPVPATVNKQTVSSRILTQ